MKSNIQRILHQMLSIGMPKNHLTYPTTMYASKVAGVRHHDLDSIYHHIHEGSRVWLETEDDNPFDQQAVRISFKGFTIGYIPKQDTERVRQLIARGKNLAKVTRVHKHKFTPTEGLEIAVTY